MSALCAIIVCSIVPAGIELQVQPPARAKHDVSERPRPKPQVAASRTVPGLVLRPISWGTRYGLARSGLWLVFRLAASSSSRGPRSLKGSLRGAPPCLPKTPLVDPCWWSRRRVHRGASPCAARAHPPTTPTTAEPSIRAKLRDPTVPGWASARPGPAAGWEGREYSGRRILCVLGGWIEGAQAGDGLIGRDGRWDGMERGAG